MPKSQQIILGILLILIAIDFFIPIIGTAFNIEILKFSSIYVKLFGIVTFIVATIFVYRQIKRKGFWIEVSNKGYYIKNINLNTKRDLITIHYENCFII